MTKQQEDRKEKLLIKMNSTQLTLEELQELQKLTSQTLIDNGIVITTVKK